MDIYLKLENEIQLVFTRVFYISINLALYFGRRGSKGRQAQCFGVLYSSSQLKSHAGLVIALVGTGVTWIQCSPMLRLLSE